MLTRSLRKFTISTAQTFLELIKLYKSVLTRKRRETQEAIDRLENGLHKLHKTQVGRLGAGLDLILACGHTGGFAGEGALPAAFCRMLLISKRGIVTTQCSTQI